MNKPPLDFEDALPRVDGDMAFLASLLDLFQEDYAERSALLADSLAKGDLGAVSGLGHAIKGASANLGLPFLRKCASDLETSAKSGDAEAAKTGFNSLEREFRKLKEYLKKYPLK
jgi:HPt (histidine-containing phosphotransfer) domain-containing protein